MIDILYFSAAWCGPCKMFKPTILNVASQFGDDVKLTPINIDDELELVKKYKIRSVPTVILLKDDKVVDQFSGVVSKYQLSEVIKLAIEKN